MTILVDGQITLEECTHHREETHSFLGHVWNPIVGCLGPSVRPRTDPSGANALVWCCVSIEPSPFEIIFGFLKREI